MAPDDGSAWQQLGGPQGPPLIERYQQIAQLSHQMLAAARRDDWDEVARLEVDCRHRIAQLKQAAMIEPLNAVEQRRRIALLRDILQHDAQMRMRAEPWLIELEGLLGIPRRVDKPKA
jgi:flagellar protein FliT